MGLIRPNEINLNMRLPGVTCIPLEQYADSRGVTAELFRIDDEMYNTWAMGYMSFTFPGKVRGPHEHVNQTDYFAFFGPGDFEVHLWDNRAEFSKPDNPVHVKFIVGNAYPCIVIIPPRVVHAYKNISNIPALALNFPNALYRGLHKREKVDEIRWEDTKNNPFTL